MILTEEMQVESPWISWIKFLSLNNNYFECMHDVIYEAESALCNINKHHLQLNKGFYVRVPKTTRLTSQIFSWWMEKYTLWIEANRKAGWHDFFFPVNQCKVLILFKRTCGPSWKQCIPVIPDSKFQWRFFLSVIVNSHLRELHCNLI